MDSYTSAMRGRKTCSSPRVVLPRRTRQTRSLVQQCIMLGSTRLLRPASEPPTRAVGPPPPAGTRSTSRLAVSLRPGHSTTLHDTQQAGVWSCEAGWLARLLLLDQAAASSERAVAETIEGERERARRRAGRNFRRIDGNLVRLPHFLPKSKTYYGRVVTLL